MASGDGDRETLEDIFVLDCDVHIDDTPEALARHCAMLWRCALENMRTAPRRYLHIRGYNDLPEEGVETMAPAFPGGFPTRTVADAKQTLETESRRELPFYDDRPSSYMSNMYFTTQPIEEPRRERDLVDLMYPFDGEDRLVFASDWPHHDFDHPRQILDLPRTSSVPTNPGAEGGRGWCRREATALVLGGEVSGALFGTLSPGHE